MILPVMDQTPHGGEDICKRRYVGRKARETIYRMYLDGATYPEIARATGVRKSTVANVVKRANRGITQGQLLERSAAKIIYPGLRKWLLDSGASMPELARACGVSFATLRDWLRGSPRAKHHEAMPKWCIDRLLAWTGLSYDQAFGRKEEDA